MFRWRSKQVEAARDRMAGTSQPALRIDRLRTSGGARLAVDRGSGDIVSSRSGDIVSSRGNDAGRRGDEADLLLVRSAGDETRGCLLAASLEADRAIGFAGSTHRAAALAFRVLRQHGPTVVALRHPVLELFACASPDPASPPTLDRCRVGGWEQFALEHAEPALLPPLVEASFAELFAVLEGDGTLADWLEAVPADTLALVGSPLFLLATRNRREELARHLAERGADPARSAPTWPASVWPRSRWTGIVLPELLGWAAARTPPRPVVPVDGAVDGIERRAAPAAVAVDGGQLLVSAIRDRIRPRRDLALLATARNEGVYLLDWLAHHRSLGVEHVFLYTNDNTDRSEGLLAALAEAGVLTVLPQATRSEEHIQRRGYNHALLELPDILDFRWTCVIDLDEYVVIDPDHFDGLVALLDLADARGADAVALNWVMHPPGRALRFRPEPLPGRFPCRHAAHDPHVKSIFRTALASGATAHAPIWTGLRPMVTLDAEGAVHHAPGQPFGASEFRATTTCGAVSVAHYHLKSLEEFIWKAARSRCSDPTHAAPYFRADHPFLPVFLEEFGRDDLVSDPVSARLAARAAAERARLAALPGVAEAERAVHAAFHDGAAMLVRTILAEEAAEPGRHNAELVQLLSEFAG